MKSFRAFPVVLLLLLGCTSKTITTPPAANQPQGEPADGDSTETPQGEDKPAPKDDGPKGIGVLEVKGIGIEQGDPNTPKTCKELCTGKGGTCVEALEPGQGGGASVAGVATYLFIQPGKPAAFLPYDLQSCTTAVPKTQEAINDTGSLYKYECSCDGIDIPPRATVKASEGIHTCNDVCTSWGKTCTNKRTWEDGSEGGALAFYGTDLRAKPFNCSTKPTASDANVKLQGYSCACE